MELKESLSELIFSKGQLKKSIYESTCDSFELFRSLAKEIITQLKAKDETGENAMRFEFIDHGDFKFEIRFASDLLIFTMHTNIFEFSRNHEVMKSAYIREDPTRSYCGVIHIYNFLADSFIYERDADLGYLIGRIFINSEKHYFIEGKRELGMLYNNFHTSVIDEASVQGIIESAMEYTTNFDLLSPPYDEVKVASVGEMRLDVNKKSMITAKRLGFRFQADTE
ncbi:MAG: hypothetical protein K5864_00985 [Bacteroidales bacterium]|nr:hypothetical protein [Bacteroidales bacterium]